VLETARLAGILAAKQTSQLIPLCHPLASMSWRCGQPSSGDCVAIETLARARAATGVEMEALTAAAVAALTVYDMCKGASKTSSSAPSSYWKERRPNRTLSAQGGEAWPEG